MNPKDDQPKQSAEEASPRQRPFVVRAQRMGLRPGIDLSHTGRLLDELEVEAFLERAAEIEAALEREATANPSAPRPPGSGL